ncbi:TPA: hypothetical protein ACXIY6_004338 [Serratia marcescens]
MKTALSKRFWRYRYALLSLVAVLGCGISAYFLFLKPGMPECRAVLYMSDQISDKLIQRVLLVSVVPDGPRKATLLVNGSLFDGDRRYVIDRILLVDYQKQGSNYRLHLKEKIRKPLDNLEKEDLNRRLPMSAPVFHWRIEQVDQRHYLFTGNNAPFFVCTTAA